MDYYDKIQIIKENDFKSVNDIYSYLKYSFKDMLQEMLATEMDVSLGELEVDIPRDRNGEFDPKIIPKYQRDISGIEEKVISLYARGISTRNIHDQLKDIYGIELSAEMVSKITDRIIPDIKEWLSRPLDTIYPFCFMDAIHYKIKEDGRIVNRAAGTVKYFSQINNSRLLPVVAGYVSCFISRIHILKMLHVHVAFSTSLSPCYITKSGADQH